MSRRVRGHPGLSFFGEPIVDTIVSGRLDSHSAAIVYHLEGGRLEVTISERLKGREAEVARHLIDRHWGAAGNIGDVAAWCSDLTCVQAAEWLGAIVAETVSA